MLVKLFDFLTNRRNAYIQRWHNRPTVWKESLAEHHFFTARIAFWLAVLAKHDQYAVAAAALFHDEPEVVTGDIPGSVKRNIPGAKDEVKRWERAARIELIANSPTRRIADIQDNMIMASESEVNTIGEFVRYADDLSALAYVQDQLAMGNQADAMIRLEASLREQCAARQYPWLADLRKEYPDLP